MEAFIKALENIKQGVEGTLVKVVEGIGKIPENVSIIANDLMARISKGIDLVEKVGFDAADDVMRAVNQGLTNLKNVIPSSLSDAEDRVKSAVSSAIDTVSNLVSQVSKNIENSRSWADYYTEAGLSDLNTVLDATKYAASQIAGLSIEDINKAVNEGGAVATATLNQILHALDQQYSLVKASSEDNAKTVLDTVKETVNNIYVTVSQDVSGLVNMVKTGLGEAYQLIYSTVTGLIQNALPYLELISLALGGLPKFIEGLFSQYFEIKPEDILDFQEQYQKLIIQKYVEGVK
jgi:phage-related protein